MRSTLAYRMKKALCVFCVALMVFAGTAISVSAKVGQVYVSRVNGLRVRRKPGSTEVITKLSKGEKVIHKGTDSGWWKIKTKDGYTGYVYRTYLRAASQKLVKNGYYKIYKASRVTLRQAPRAGATAVATAKRGTTVQLKAKRGNWGYVVIDGTGNKGWVQVKYLYFLRS